MGLTTKEAASLRLKHGRNEINVQIPLGYACCSILGFYAHTKKQLAENAYWVRVIATVKRDGQWYNVHAVDLVPGDLVLLAAGSIIPADCRINNGQIDVDQSALTGESLPVTMARGDSCKQGSTVVRGEVEGTVEYTGQNTFFGKATSLIYD